MNVLSLCETWLPAAGKPLRDSYIKHTQNSPYEGQEAEQGVFQYLPTLVSHQLRNILWFLTSQPYALAEHIAKSRESLQTEDIECGICEKKLQ